MGLSNFFLGLAILLLILMFQLIYGLIYHDGKNKNMIKAVVGSTYFARSNEFKIYNRFAKSGGIVFVGDSLTQRYPLSEFYPGLPIYNRGIDGDTTVGLMKRLALSVFDLKPKVMVLQIGTNDLQVANIPKESTIQNIQDIVSLIQTTQPTIQIILVSLYPVNRTSEKLVEKMIVGPRMNEDIIWMNDRIKQIPGVYFVDVYAQLLNDQGQLDMRHSKEGLHLSLSGYATITPFIQAKIDALF